MHKNTDTRVSHPDTTPSSSQNVEKAKQLFVQISQHLDDKEYTCKLCGSRFGGLDLLIHIHIDHKLEQSDVCPCADCNISKIKRVSADIDWTNTINGLSSLALDLEAEHFPVWHDFSDGSQRGKENIEQERDVAGPLGFHGSWPASQSLRTQEQQDKSSHGLTKSRSSKDGRAQNTTPSEPSQNEPDPENVLFFRGDGEICEKNLPYEMSLIEYGNVCRDGQGQTSWFCKLEAPPEWLDANGHPVMSPFTHKKMKELPFLPNEIEWKVPGWMLLLWYRQAAKQGLKLEYQDLFDRMRYKLSRASIKRRMQKWRLGMGLLSQTNSGDSSWPSSDAMNTIRELSYLQLKFNTWWEVECFPGNVYVVRQPRQHYGYLDQRSRPAEVKSPWYFVLKPEERKISANVKLIDDALLFLDIKAAECGMTGGLDGILDWFSLKVFPNRTDDLALELIDEFHRWRDGCRNTPPVDAFRTALESASSVEEYNAIKEADYSLTTWLRDMDEGLTLTKGVRSKQDNAKNGGVMSKGMERVHKPETVAVEAT